MADYQYQCPNPDCNEEFPNRQVLVDGKKCPKCGTTVIKLIHGISAVELLQQKFGARRWIAKGIIPRGGVTIAAGKRGCHKTWSLLCLGKAVAAGEPFFGHYVTEKAPVLLLDYESGAFTLHERLKLMGNHAPEDFRINSFPELSFGDEKGRDSLRFFCERNNGALIIIDSLARVAGFSDENRAEEVGTMLTFLKTLCDAHDVTFVLVHHLRKGQGRESQDDDSLDRLRGSSEIPNVADSVLEFSKTKDPSALIMRHTKSRVGLEQGAARIDLRINEEGASFVYAGTWEDIANKPEQAAKAIKKWIFEQVVRQFRTAELQAGLKGNGFNHRAIGRALKMLVDNGQLMKPEKGRFVVPSGTLEDFGRDGTIGQNGQNCLSDDKNDE